MSRKIKDLRELLFTQLQKLADCDAGNIEEEAKRAVNMANLADTILKSGELEVKFYEATIIAPREDGLFLKPGDIKREVKPTSFLDEFIQQPSKE